MPVNANRWRSPSRSSRPQVQADLTFAWQIRAQAGIAVARCIDGFEDPARRKSTLGFQSAIVFRRKALEVSPKRPSKPRQVRLLKPARSNARARDLAVELALQDVENLLRPTACPATGMPFLAGTEGQGRNPWGARLGPASDSRRTPGGDNRVVCCAWKVMHGEPREDELRHYASALITGRAVGDARTSRHPFAHHVGRPTAPRPLAWAGEDPAPSQRARTSTCPMTGWPRGGRAGCATPPGQPSALSLTRRPAGTRPCPAQVGLPPRSVALSADFVSSEGGSTMRGRNGTTPS